MKHDERVQLFHRGISLLVEASDEPFESIVDDLTDTFLIDEEMADDILRIHLSRSAA